MSSIVEWIAWLVALGLFASSVSRLRDLRFVGSLPDLDGPRARPPRVSIVVPARNEESRIEESVRRLAGQQGIDLQLIVVDDRSSDRTPEILSRLANELAVLETVRVEELPEGWLGKTHACELGASRARGDWLLFSDADAQMEPALVLRAVAAAEQTGVAHVCLFPRESDATVASRAAGINFAVGLLHYAARVNRDHPGYYIGFGAFNLVRADAYRAVGGHRALRTEIIDDMMLGLLLRRAGFRSRAFGAFWDLEVHWAPTAPAMIRALEKNMFAMFHYSPLLAGLVAVAMATAFSIAVAAPFVGGWAGLAAIAGWCSTLVPNLVMTRHSGIGSRAALLAPLLTPVLIAAVGNSALRAWRRGGIEWRGRFYPFDALRGGGA